MVFRIEEKQPASSTLDGGEKTVSRPVAEGTAAIPGESALKPVETHSPPGGGCALEPQEEPAVEKEQPAVSAPVPAETAGETLSDPGAGAEAGAAADKMKEAVPGLTPADGETAKAVQIGSEPPPSGPGMELEPVNGSGKLAPSPSPVPQSTDEEAPAGGETTEKPAPATPVSRRAVIKDASEKGLSVEGKVVAIVRGGFEVDLGGVIALCPFSQIDLRQSSNQLGHLHKTYVFKILSYKRGGRRILLTRRSLLQKEARQALREMQRRLKIGSVQEGKVVSLTDFGAFVDINGVQGMIHVSEISHERIAKPLERLKVGEAVRVKILKSDRRRGRLSLSMKALEEDPWRQVGSKLRQRQVVKGKKARLTEFGIFAEVLPGVEGLLHLSEIPDEKLEEIKRRVVEGEELPVLILSVEMGKRRISLSLPPEGTKPGDRVDFMSLKQGNIVAGVVQKVDTAGVHVRLGPGRTGLIPPVETGTSRDADLKKLFQVGQEVTALVMGAERGGGGRRARLSIRKAQRREERKQIEDYRRSAASGAGSFATLGDFFQKG